MGLCAFYNVCMYDFDNVCVSVCCACGFCNVYVCVGFIMCVCVWVL